MKAFTILTALALGAVANAQLEGLPTCATTCASQFLAGSSGSSGVSNCGANPKCICENKQFISDISCCLAQPGGCNAEDQQKAITYASQICAANGVQVPSVVSCATSAPATSTTGTGTGTPATSTGSGATGAGASTSRSTAWAPHATAAPAAAGVLGGLVAAVAML